MKWRGRRASTNISDRRGGRGGRVARTGGGLGVGAILLLLAGAYFGVDLSPFIGLMSGGGGGTVVQQAPSGPNEIDDEIEEFVAVVLADTEEVWSREFEARGARYQKPTLVLFSGAVRSACGSASAAMGPFYCPGDTQVYLDASFFRTLERRLGARGDFAKAYVIAHEVGHHVQNLTGVMAETARLRPQLSEVENNRMSVRVELQADCYSGIWARGVEAFGVLEEGDIEEALNAASRIGDDTLQAQSGRAVVPDSFTHGSSEQRQRWFYRGYRTGRMEECDTFSATRL